LTQVRKLHQEQGFRVATRHTRAAAVEFHLTHEQTQAMETITSQGRIQVLCGLSGTGKTHTLAAAYQAWERQGYDVLGVSLSGRQSERLTEQTGIGQQTLLSKVLWGEKQQSMTISKLLWEIDRAAESQRRYGSRSVVKSPLSAKSVVVIDNAQAIGTSHMKQLVEETRRAGAKLVLSGDLEQPQAYAHSGALKAIAQSVGMVELKEIQRQEQTWAKQVVQQVGKGQAQSALQTLAARGLLSVAETKEEAMLEVVNAWSVRGLKRSQDHLMIAETPDDAQILNRLAQAKLVEGEYLGKTAVRVGIEYIRKGERIQFRETSRTYGVMKNGMGTVKHIDPITKVAMVRLDTGKLKAINLRHYTAIGLGYAVTTSEAKEIEIRHSYVLAQGKGRDSALVQVSLAQADTKVFTYALDKEVETILKLATQMKWSKLNELAIMLQSRKLEQDRSQQ